MKTSKHTYTVYLHTHKLSCMLYKHKHSYVYIHMLYSQVRLHTYIHNAFHVYACAYIFIHTYMQFIKRVITYDNEGGVGLI